MKIKKGFMLRKLGEKNIVVAVGDNDFNGLIKLNNTASFLWKNLQTETTEEELAKKMVAEFDIDDATAKADIDDFVETLKNKNLLD